MYNKYKEVKLTLLRDFYFIKKENQRVNAKAITTRKFSKGAGY